ncbi:hypothetical protein [Methylomicrobium lacus]|uniref:hypothetical protein n=1 Tax=Methylomicrobium lacus TaxID=136992 RepID=UPI0035A961C9
MSVCTTLEIDEQRGIVRVEPLATMGQLSRSLISRGWTLSVVSELDSLTVRDYFHRHTRSYFWAMEEIIAFGKHPIFRALLGWALPPRIELLKYTETETTRWLREKFHVVQDDDRPCRL